MGVANQVIGRRNRLLFQILFGVSLAACVIAIYQAVTLSVAELDGLFPWQNIRLQGMLWAAGAWFLFVSGADYLVFSGRVGFNLHRIGIPRSSALLVLAALVVGFVGVYGWLAVARHESFNSTGYDLTIHEQIVWNTVHGRFYASSLEVDNSFANHFRPFLIALVPFYAIWPSPNTLLLLQTVALALGAVPLYLLALAKLRQRLPALALAAVYLLYPALGFVARFDVHAETFAVPAFLRSFRGGSTIPSRKRTASLPR